MTSLENVLNELSVQKIEEVNAGSVVRSFDCDSYDSVYWDTSS